MCMRAVCFVGYDVTYRHVAANGVPMRPGRFMRTNVLLAVAAAGVTACGTQESPPGSASVLLPVQKSVAEAEVPLLDGVRLPGGVTPVGPAPHRLRRDKFVEWRATYSLGSSSEPDVLDAVERSITTLGWTVQRGRHDVFAARCSTHRCELLIARTLPLDSGSPSRTEVLVMYASRPA